MTNDKMKETSHRIEDVRIEKDSVLLLFPSQEIQVDFQTYSQGYYYPGKSLDEKTFRSLQQSEKLNSARKYLSSLLTSRRYSVFQCCTRLKQKYRISEKDIQNLLRPYIESHVLDDKAYAIDFAQDRCEKGYGKNRILAQLKEKHIAAEILESLELQKLFEDGNTLIHAILEKIDQSKSKMTLEKKKMYMCEYLLRRGYAKGVILENIESYFSSRNVVLIQKEAEKRSILLKKEALKCYNFVQRQHLTAARKKDAFIRKLLQKGFHYDEIQSLLESEDYCFYD